MFYHKSEENPFKKNDIIVWYLYCYYTTN